VKRMLLILALVVASAAQAKVTVVATVSDLGALAREIGGEEVDVKTMALPTQDPHYVDAKPSLVVLLARADLLLLNGIELEVGWLPALQVSARNPAIQVGNPGYLDCSTLITPKEVPLAKLDRSMGDIHPGGNPHYTKDPRNALQVAQGIARKLSELDPPHAALFNTNLARFQSDLKAHIAQWEQALAPYNGTKVVTYHQSWIYFTEWSGLQEVAFLEPKPGIQPNPNHIANVFNVIKTQHIPVVLQEQWYSGATGELLAKTTGATLVRVFGMTPNGQTYTQAMGDVVTAVVNALAQHKT